MNFDVFITAAASLAWLVVMFAPLERAFLRTRQSVFRLVMNLELRSQAPGFKLHKAPLYRYHVRADSICHRPDAAEAADTAYRTVIDTLKEGGFRMTEEVRNLALEGFEQRRRTNAAFAVAQAAGEVKTFQDFLARQET